MEYIYILSYNTEKVGTVWQKAYANRLSARKALNTALGKEIFELGNDFKSGDEDCVTLRHGTIYITEILIETE